MKRKCVFSIAIVATLAVLSVVAFVSSLTGMPADGLSGQGMVFGAATDIGPEVTTRMGQAVTGAAPAEKPAEVPYRPPVGKMVWDERGSYLLAKIAMAEAESEDIEGKALVILVVLNRVGDDEFPDTIEEVLYQQGQFSPIGNGRFDEVEPDADCWAALDLVMLEGWDGSCGATYFESKSESTWHSENLTFLFRHENIISIQTGRGTMVKGKAARNLITVVYTLAVTLAVGKWAICMAYLERGYEAIGGEYCLVFMVCWVAWKAINYLFDTLEDMEYGKKRNERGRRNASWMRDNR